MTLNALSWATLANYGTGPDVGTPTKVDPASAANGFVAGVIAAPQHVNYLVSLIAGELLKAIDGAGGGTYTLVNPLIFSGADVRFGGDVDFQATSLVSFGGALDINADMDLDAASTFTVHGAIDLLGAMAVHGGGSIDVTSLGEINVTSADVNINSGAQILLNGGSIILDTSGHIQVNAGTVTLAAGSVLTVEDGEDLVINDAAEGLRLTLTPAFHDVAGQWEKNNAAGTIAWKQSDVAVARSIWFALPVNPGDTVVNVYARVEAEDHPGGMPAFADMPVLELITVDLDGVVTSIATKTDNSGTEPAYDALHDIVLQAGTTDTGAMPHVATADPIYVRLGGEKGANAVTGLTLRSISGNVIARSFRAANMVR